jgi:hypothetical protein
MVDRGFRAAQARKRELSFIKYRKGYIRQICNVNSHPRRHYDLVLLNPILLYNSPAIEGDLKGGTFTLYGRVDFERIPLSMVVGIRPDLAAIRLKLFSLWIAEERRNGLLRGHALLDLSDPALIGNGSLSVFEVALHACRKEDKSGTDDDRPHRFSPRPVVR